MLSWLITALSSAGTRSLFTRLLVAGHWQGQTDRLTLTLRAAPVMLPGRLFRTPPIPTAADLPSCRGRAKDSDRTSHQSCTIGEVLAVRSIGGSQGRL